MKPDLSIILPLYNVENTLVNALNSIACQYVYEDIQLEIILVDDISTDNSLKIAKEWAKNSIIPVTILENTEKLFALKSRLRGLQIAKAEDIMFVDADDILLGSEKDPRLMRMIKEKQAKKCDILHGSTQAINPENILIGELSIFNPLSLTKEERGLIHQPKIYDTYSQARYFPVVLWGKIYSKSLLEEIQHYAHIKLFPQFEDKFFTTLLFLHAKSYAVFEEYIYTYYFTTSFNTKTYAYRTQALLDAWRIIKDAMDKKNIKKETQDNIEDFFHWRLIINGGYLTIKLEEECAKLEKPVEEIFKEVDISLADKDLFTCLLFCNTDNANTIMKKIERLRYDHYYKTLI